MTENKTEKRIWQVQMMENLKFNVKEIRMKPEIAKSFPSTTNKIIKKKHLKKYQKLKSINEVVLQLPGEKRKVSDGCLNSE